MALEAVTARSEVGRRLDELFPRHRVPLATSPSIRLASASSMRRSSPTRTVPRPRSSPALRARGLRVVDLSADFRLHDLDAYGAWYGEHGAPELVAGGGLRADRAAPVRDRGAELVANPGCYSTAAVLALAPLARAGLIEEGIVDAKSGVSGAGREATGRRTSSPSDENVNAYGVEGHRHAPEIDQELLALGCAETVTFTPHLLPLDQGLLASCYVTPTRALDADELRALFAEAYAGEPFIELTDEPPGVRDVRDTNLCRIHATVEPRTGRALVFARSTTSGRVRRAGGPEPQLDAGPRRGGGAGMSAPNPDRGEPASVRSRWRWGATPGGCSGARPRRASRRLQGCRSRVRDQALGPAGHGTARLRRGRRVSAARFTRNALVAAPVLVSQQKERSRLRAVVVNSGNANVSTGEEGLAVAEAMSMTAADALELPHERVGGCLDGRHRPGPRPVAGDQWNRRGASVAVLRRRRFRARHLTTDRWPKYAGLELSLSGGSVRLCAQAKGGG